MKKIITLLLSFLVFPGATSAFSVIDLVVHFKENEVNFINKTSYLILDDQIFITQSSPVICRVDILGHADDREKDPEGLSLKRAEAVKSYMVMKGVSANRLATKGYGAQNPITKDLAKDYRARNRRVDFIIQENCSAGIGVAPPPSKFRGVAEPM